MAINNFIENFLGILETLGEKRAYKTFRTPKEIGQTLRKHFEMHGNLMELCSDKFSFSFS